MKQIIKIITFTLFFSLFSKVILSENLRFFYDICPFKNDDNRLYIELYYCFYQNELKFIKSPDGYEADGFISIGFKDLVQNKSVFQKQYKVPLTVLDTTADIKNNILTGQLNLLLDSGNYDMKIIAADFNNMSDSVVYEENLTLVRFQPNKISMSGIQLCNDIKKSTDTKSIFYKNTLEVIPNPMGVFGNNLTALNYYFELYNLTSENLSEDYSIVTQISDLNDKPLKTNEKKYKIKNSSKVEFGSFDIKDLKTNTYKFIVNVYDDKSKQVLSNQKKFRIYNTDTTSNNSIDFENSYLLSEYANYSEEQLNSEFSYATYLSSQVEREQFENIKNIEGKRKFMNKFWQNKEITKKDYMKRIKFANANFKYDFKEGYLTDRGRIFCLYGKPSQIDKYPFQGDTREYEIWHYDAIQGGVIFVFIDLSNDGGNFVLVHSTALNEIRNDSWMDKIKIIK